MGVNFNRTPLGQFGKGKRGKYPHRAVPAHYQGVDKWMEANQGKHFCHCGCNTVIVITKFHHTAQGIPQFLPGHRSKLADFKSAQAERNSAYRGAKHWNWRGGITKVREQIRKTKEYKQWRLACLTRDNYTCQRCGFVGQPGNRSVEVHHLVQVSILLDVYGRNETVLKRKLFSLFNGVTLCEPCHKKIPVPNRGKWKRKRSRGSV